MADGSSDLISPGSDVMISASEEVGTGLVAWMASERGTVAVPSAKFPMLSRGGMVAASCSDAAGRVNDKDDEATSSAQGDDT